MKKQLYRFVRRNPAVEFAWRYLRRSQAIDVPELDLTIPAGPGDIIIDCGANVGDLASRFARTGAKVYAFEPNPLCYSIIKRRFALLGSVTSYNKGVMDRPCTLKLETPKPHAGFDNVDVTVAASFVRDGNFGVEVECVEVECVDLADFIEKLDRPIALLKLDIEGAEVPVINHLLDRGLMDKIKMALVETHEEFSEELAIATDALKQRIADAGYSDRFRLDWI